MTPSIPGSFTSKLVVSLPSTSSMEVRHLQMAYLCSWIRSELGQATTGGVRAGDDDDDDDDDYYY